MIRWDHVERDLYAGEPHDHLAATDESGYVTLRIRSDENDDWICAFTVGLKGSKWSLPQVENWMTRCADLLNAEPVVGDGL